jgi:hypothetical protein
LSLRKIHLQTFQIPQNFTKSTKNLFFFEKTRWPKKPIKLSLFIGFLSVFYWFIGFSSGFWKKLKKIEKNGKKGLKIEHNLEITSFHPLPRYISCLAHAAWKPHWLISILHAPMPSLQLFDHLPEVGQLSKARVLEGWNPPYPDKLKDLDTEKPRNR